ncbi:hypothetical protein ACJ5NV_05590 [Loktanella agnita]|uniref:hypothetical protein n=1 Tax=Loktanella agnita TaxID=287097 RepID=UPI003987DA3C
MPQERFKPIDAEDLIEKADSLDSHQNNYTAFADPRQDRTAYEDLIGANDESLQADHNLNDDQTVMRRLGRFFAMLPGLRRLHSTEK